MLSGSCLETVGGKSGSKVHASSDRDVSRNAQAQANEVRNVALLRTASDSIRWRGWGACA